MWWWNGYGPGPWMFGPFMMIVALIIFGAMMFFMMRGMMGGHGQRNERALEILKERFARGEITENVVIRSPRRRAAEWMKARPDPGPLQS